MSVMPKPPPVMFSPSHPFAPEAKEVFEKLFEDAVKKELKELEDSLKE